LHNWQETGTEHHWLIPVKKNLQYEIIRSLGRNNKLIKLMSNPRARKLWPELPKEITAKLITRKINGEIMRLSPR
jgi:hypothetical protein